MATRGTERRKAPRRLTNQNAWIVGPASASRDTFRLFDISTSGARICVLRDVPLPEEFLLLLTRDGRVQRRCRTVWRDDAYVGVEFIANRGKIAPREDRDGSAEADAVKDVNLDCLALTALQGAAPLDARAG